MTQTPSFSFIVFVTLVISLLGLIGGLLVLWREQKIKGLTKYLMSFAAGSILGAALLELLPEALEESPNPHTIGLWILAGVLVFFVLEKLLILHHHTHDESTETQMHGDEVHGFQAVRPLIIIGDALHNFLDGIVIAIAFLTDMRIGVITALAVIAHEIPQEIGDFGILLHSGMARRRVLFWNVLGALLGPLGAVVAFAARDTYEKIAPAALALVVGNFVYLALADLIPAIRHERKISNTVVQIVLVVIGVVLVWLLGEALPEG